jgi:UDP-N-acetylglucosamine 2-epimerase (non-hydrolysing)
MKRIAHIVGARPNFMKAAPVMAALDCDGIAEQVLVHTGQHYDFNMSRVFFHQLGLPEPTVNLGVGSGSHAVQTSQIMQRFEEWVLGYRPDMVLVYGDVNSTLAATVVCSKIHIPVAHVEAGLRSFDRSMPEEINRLVTDQIADLLFAPSQDGVDNLGHEGVSPERIHLVGNVMIDTLVRLLPRAEESGASRELSAWRDTRYALVTLHRPSNVDSPATLRSIMMALQDIAASIPVVFPVHPRTRQKLDSMALPACPGVHLLEPIGYLEFLAMQRRAKVIITDSGGIQEESTFLQVPCLTLRENTERPVTVSIGTNILIGHDMALLRDQVGRVLNNDFKKGSIPPLWDGNASGRIATVVANS